MSVVSPINTRQNGRKDYRAGRDCWHMSCLGYGIVNNICSLSKTAMAQGWTICLSSLGTRNCKGVTLLILTLQVVFALVSLFYDSQYRDYSILEMHARYYTCGHFCVILREFVVSALPVYTNAVVGNIILNLKLFHISLCCWNIMFKIFKILKVSNL